MNQLVKLENSQGRHVWLNPETVASIQVTERSRDITEVKLMSGEVGNYRGTPDAFLLTLRLGVSQMPTSER